MTKTDKTRAPGKLTERVHVLFPSELKRRAEEEAANRGVSFGQVLRSAVEAVTSNRAA